MEPKRFPLTNGTLEDWLRKRTKNSFPDFNEDMGELPFPKRYKRIKEVLLPYHKAIEKEELLQSLKKWESKFQNINKLEGEDYKKELKKFHDSNPFHYLNNHGVGHVRKVIERASEIFKLFPKCKLNAYEGYLLLCAIQFHDIGNIFGREEHEKKINEIMEQKCKQILRDRFERDLIVKIAMVHGGLINDDRDTIKNLNEKPRSLYGHPFRERLLAAILRFSDELADDSSRCDKEGLENNTLPPESIIYHKYSESLPSVTLGVDSENRKHCVRLEFDFDGSDAFKTFKKNGKDIYLLDEIYNRTVKMERERRYCMRFLRPEISIEQIRVEIWVQNPRNKFQRDEIKYTLEEMGYPDEPSSIKSFPLALKTGKEEMIYLKKQWGYENG